MPASVPLYLPLDKWLSRSGQVPSLDGLRATSVSIVLLGHLVLPSALVGVSALGLSIFFFISGFLITRLFFAEARETGHISLVQFYLRRILRLYPVILVYLAVILTFAIIWHVHVLIIDVFSVLFYFSNYLLVHYESLHGEMSIPVGVLWSLSVEEHFYLFAPLAFVLTRARAATILRIAIGICIASLLLRCLYVVLWPGIEHTLFIYRHSETRADSIAYGVVLACLCELEIGQKFIKILASRTGFIIGAVILIASYAWRDDLFQNTIRFTIQSLALMPLIAGVVFAAPVRPANIILNHPVMRWIGRLSYSIYVWHGGVGFLFNGLLVRLPHTASIVAELVLTLSLATLSYYVIERPVLRLRHRLHPHARTASARSSAQAADASATGAPAPTAAVDTRL